MDEVNVTSVLNFRGYDVNNIIFNRNQVFFDNKNLIDREIKLQFKYETEFFSVNDTDFDILLGVKLSPAVDEILPFNLDIALTGHYSVDKDAPRDIFIQNAIAILFPYLRTLVSNTTLNANITPLILPCVNINKMVSINKVDDIAEK